MTTYKKLSYDNSDCMVEVANRDGAGNVIANTYQKNLTAGQNIAISNNVITAVGGGYYTTGTGLNLSNNELSVDTSVIASKSYVDARPNWATVTGTTSIVGSDVYIKMPDGSSNPPIGSIISIGVRSSDRTAGGHICFIWNGGDGTPITATRIDDGGTGSSIIKKRYIGITSATSGTEVKCRITFWTNNYENGAWTGVTDLSATATYYIQIHYKES